MANRTNPVFKVARGILSTSKELQSLEQELASELNLSNPESPTPRDNEVLRIKDKRFQLNEEINPILKEVHPLSRKKNFTHKEAEHLERLQTRRDEIFATLKEMPDLGYTKKQWNRLSDEDKKQTLGRPGISLELKIIRDRISLDELKEELSSVQENLDSDFKKEIKKKIGHFPATFDDVLNNGQEFEDTRIKGSDASKEISKIERSIQRVVKEIEYIESGEAEAEQEQIMQERLASGKSMGRPFEPLEEKLAKLKKKKARMEQKIENLEKTLSPYEQISRKVSVARKELREQLKVVEENGLDIKSDSDHPIVQEYRRKELILKNFMDERTNFRKKGSSINVFAGFDFGMPEQANEHEQETVVAETSQDSVAESTSQASEDRALIKEQMLAKARMKAKMKMKAKMLMKKKAQEAAEAEKREANSDKDALRSII